MRGLKIFIFFLTIGFRTFSCQDQVSLYRENSVKWETKYKIVRFYLRWGTLDSRLVWEVQAWEKSVRQRFYSLDLSKNSAWYSPIIFWLRGMNSYDACYWDIVTTEKHLKITMVYLVPLPCDQNYFYNLSSPVFTSCAGVLRSSYAGAQRIPLMRRNVVKSKNIPKAKYLLLNKLLKHFSWDKHTDLLSQISILGSKRYKKWSSFCCSLNHK